MLLPLIWMAEVKQIVIRNIFKISSSKIVSQEIIHGGNNKYSAFKKKSEMKLLIYF